MNLGLTGKVRINDASTNYAYNYLTTTKNMTIIDGGAFDISSINNLDTSSNSVLLLGQNNNNINIGLQNNNTIYLLDNGGISNNYSSNLDLSFTLDLSNVTNVDISGYISVVYGNDFFRLYKNSISNSNILYDSSNVASQYYNTINRSQENISISHLKTNGDKLIITFKSDDVLESFGFYLIIKPT